MISELQSALDGKTRVQCPMTLTKRITQEAGKVVDRRPLLAVILLSAVIALFLFGVTATIVNLLV